MFGRPMASALTALQSAALETALALRECGELDENMYPSAASAAATRSSSANHGDAAQQHPHFGSTKRRQYYYKQAAKYLTTAPEENKRKMSRVEVRAEEGENEGGVRQDDGLEGAVENESAVDNGTTRYRLYALDLRLSCPIPDDQG